MTIWKAASVACLAAGLAVAGSPVEARDFFSSFFRGIVESPEPALPPPTALPYGDPSAAANGAPVQAPSPRYASGSTAYCVRTCDGRYFPISATGNQSKAETCHSLCPTADTKVVYGSDIDSAATDTGKPYSSLPNAFRYRSELVNGCTCNGKTPGGLAQIKPEDDPTMRKGDLVANADGVLVASRGEGSGQSRRAANYPPASRRSSHRQTISIPVMAAE